jgi:uncharacterized protein (UPF0335 family)
LVIQPALSAGLKIITGKVIALGFTGLLNEFINKGNKMTNNIGHNSAVNKDIAALLKQYIEGVESYQDQIKDLQGSVKEIFDNAKASGFDVKTIKKIIKEKAKDKTKRGEKQYLLETYCASDSVGIVLIFINFKLNILWKKKH